MTELVQTNQSIPARLQTRGGCIEQIVKAEGVIKQGQRLADEAMAAYLQLPGTSLETLRQDLEEAGQTTSKKTLQNRQAMLRKANLLPPAGEQFRRDGNGGHSRSRESSAEVTALVEKRLAAKLEQIRAEEATKRAAKLEADEAASRKPFTGETLSEQLLGHAINASAGQQVAPTTLPLDDSLSAAWKRISDLENENAKLRAEVERLQAAKPRKKAGTDSLIEGIVDGVATAVEQMSLL